MSNPTNIASADVAGGSNAAPPWGSNTALPVTQLAQARNASVYVLGGSGMVSQVAYCRLSSPHSIILSEPLNLVSLVGLVTDPSEPGSASFTAALSSLNGSVFGGRILNLVAMDSVLLTALLSQKREVFHED
ncbi:hypothetical protein DCAR_0831210 [Daucus carota subsp. sativus]|uniref:PPC domain-containing protein n=1 Tax=Daucus carota subsp. sativus TaxID=79200 RepID=A0AAF1B9U1_DAUCS|nr:PREDICTED: AT-hook motif nuclear-localized protein 20-like [Daucus carota subsp. sativus]WOH11719.1 hypothetical protein DCAR_0831210 [Daucus carota subsp. sativus]